MKKPYKTPDGCPKNIMSKSWEFQKTHLNSTPTPMKNNADTSQPPLWLHNKNIHKTLVRNSKIFKNTETIRNSRWLHKIN